MATKVSGVIFRARKNHFHRSWTILISLFLFATNIFAADKILDVSQFNQPSISLTEYFAVLEDASLNSTLDDVQKADVAAQFKTDFPPASALNMGYSRSAYWLRFTLKNATDQPLERIFEIGHPLLSNVQFYQPSANGYQSQKTGLAQPFSSRAYDHRNFVFPLTLPAHSQQIYYLRLQSTNTLIVPARLWQLEAFHRYERSDYFFQPWYFGVAIAMILFNLFLFLALRDSIYLFYVIFASCMSLSVASSSGLSSQFLWSEATDWADIATLVFSSLTMLTWIVFMRRMINTQAVIPRFDSVLKVLIGIYLITIAGLVFSQPLFARFVVWLYQFSAIVILGVALICSVKRQRSAYFFLAASTLLCLSIVMFTLKAMGLLPTNFFTLNAIRFSSGAEMLLLAFALADRFDGMRKQKEKAQQLLVENLKSSEQILEARVLERTNALEIAGSKLELLVEKERANSVEKSNFLAMLTHELKSPLATIELATENIQRSENPDITALSLKHIQAAAHDMSVITQRCLQADRLEQGSSTLNVTAFSLDVLIHEILNGLADSSRVQLEISPPLSITSDEFLCRIVVSNLVENALKYSPPKSVVTLSAKETAEPSGVLLSVCNEIGKAGKPDPNKIFEKYYRSTNAQRLRGTGLGLWLVRGIATQLKGQVDYLEHHNKVEFQLWLPK